MAALFVDTSSLAKRYITETGTAWVKALLDPTSGNQVYLARVTTVELIAAITWRERGGPLRLLPPLLPGRSSAST
ncbi:MAG TPA: hypothetical protein VFB38_19595 [Chthonomonadaceae bacterium]|jgi:predicted nucleic acid-binding protein|nr:hypothetical protein [Chthonomonadaceae bacterium]